MFQPCIHEGTVLKACENYAETPKWLTGFLVLWGPWGTISTLVAFPPPCGVSGGVLEPPLSSREQNLSLRKAGSRQDNFCSPPAPGENAAKVGKQAIWKIPSHSSSL